MNKFCAESRNLCVALFLRFSNIFSVKIKLIKIKKNFLGMQPNFESRENRLVFRPFPNRNGHLVGPKRGPEISSKKAAISYFNLFCKPYNETTTESSKTLGPGTCQTRAIFCLIQSRFLRNIFCSDLSLIRCRYDYVIFMT